MPATATTERSRRHTCGLDVQYLHAVFTLTAASASAWAARGGPSHPAVLARTG